MKTIGLKTILIFCSLINSFAYAQSATGPTPGQNVVTGGTTLVAGAGRLATPAAATTAPPGCPEDVNSQASLSQLFFMGRTLIQLEPGMRIGQCVQARTDQAARSACPVAYYNTVVNPANPQYGENAMYADIRSWGGSSRSSSEDRVYYCISSPRTIPQIKAARCAEAQTDMTCNVGGLFTFTYSGQNRNESGNYADGDCVRSGPGVSANQAARLVCAESTAAETVAEPVATPSPDPASPAVTVAAAVPPDSLTQINQCIARWRRNGQSCKTGAEDAVAQCNSTRNHNNTVSGISGAIGALGQGVTMVHQGQGTQGTCFQTGAAALAARAALDTTKQNCTAGETFCSSACQVNQVDAMIAECLQAGGYASLSQLETAHSDIASNLQDAKTEVTELYSQGRELCTTQVRTQRMSLDSLVSDLGRTLQSSTICACQTSSSNGTNCAEIPTIDACQTNPTAPGCQAYVPIAACSTTSPYYNAQLCNCTQNPNATGCRTVVTTPPTVSTFGGNLAGGSVPQNSGGSISFGGGGGGSSGGGSFSDLSIPGGGGSAVPANFAGNIKAGEISSGGGATGASVGGGGNGSAGLAGNVSGTAGPPPEKGLGSLFKDLKNVVSNVFGGGTKAAPSAQKANGAIDINRFKPNTKVRGGPVQRDIASANEKTLFELVNDCANGLRCKNSGDYLVNP